MSKFIKYSVQQICDILEIELPDEYKDIANDKVTNITSVVNSLSYGGAFILMGANAEDRAKQLKRALEKKPKLVLAGRAGMRLEQIKEVPHIQVKDPYDAVVSLSEAMRNELGVKVIGVTGSLGKTTTKELLYSVLKQEYMSDKNFGNRNNTKGIFLSVQGIAKDVEYYIQEYGVAIGKRSMESKIQACVPNAAVVTNISDPHIETFGSREKILEEKIKLVTEMEEGCPAFLNYDDELLRKVELQNHPIISYAVNNKEADYYVENLQVYDGYMKFDIVHKGRYTPVVLNSIGIHNVGNAVVAMAVGEWAGVPIEKIVEGIDQFRSEGIRQILTDIGGYKLYIDCYNTSPVSTIGAVKTIERLEIKEGGKRIAVIGEMRSLGDFALELHEKVGKEVGASNVDLVICFGGEHAKYMAEIIKKYDKAVLYTDKRDVLNYWIQQIVTRKDVTLYKGANMLKLHKTIDQVYGTSLHFSEHYITLKEGDYELKIVIEEDESLRVLGTTKYLGTSENPDIPNSYDGLELFSIGESTFKGKSIKAIKMPDSVVNIAANAFSECSELEEIVLSQNLKNIEEKAFYGCSMLKEVVIPEGVIEIGESVFEGCTSLTKVILPSTIGRIGKDAFKDCIKVEFEYTEGSYAEAYVFENVNA